MYSTVEFRYKESLTGDTEYNIYHHDVTRGLIKYIQNYDRINQICREIHDNVLETCLQRVPIAIDLEWKANHVKNAPPNPISVIQLCLNPNLCYVFSIQPGTIPEMLATVLHHDNCKLIGCGIKNDIRLLYHFYPSIFKKHVMIYNCIELGQYIRRMGQQSTPGGVKNYGIRFLQLIWGKSARTQMSDWSKTPLTKAQICYAAMDVYIPLKVYFLIKKSID